MAPNRKTLIALGVATLLIACAIGVAVITSSGAPRTPQPPATPTPTVQPPATPVPTPDIQTVWDNTEEVYPFERLEEVKDFLTDYMDQYSILFLDADELTNRVDVGLKSYTEESMEQIRTLVYDRYPDVEGCLRFEDYSDMIISFTSGQESATP